MGYVKWQEKNWRVLGEALEVENQTIPPRTAKREISKMQKLNLQSISQIANELGLLPRLPRMRYFQTSRKDPYRFCWTTERLQDGKFYAVIYRERRDGVWVLKRKLGFAKRRVAKARALAWMEKRKVRCRS